MGKRRTFAEVERAARQDERKKLIEKVHALVTYHFGKDDLANKLRQELTSPTMATPRAGFTAAIYAPNAFLRYMRSKDRQANLADATPRTQSKET